MNTTMFTGVFMRDKRTHIWVQAAERFKAGEDLEAIRTTLSKSKFWLYKWIKRLDDGGVSWYEE